MPERDQTWLPRDAQNVPKRSRIGVESSHTEPESTNSDFFEIIGPFGEPFGDHFGAERHEPYVKKTSENQGRTNIENHAQTSQKLC